MQGHAARTEGGTFISIWFANDMAPRVSPSGFVHRNIEGRKKITRYVVDLLGENKIAVTMDLSLFVLGIPLDGIGGVYATDLAPAPFIAIEHLLGCDTVAFGCSVVGCRLQKTC